LEVNIMAIPIVPLLAAAKVANLSWLGFHLIRTRSYSEANRAVANDTDAAVSYGKDAVALVRVIYGLNGLEAYDLTSFANTVRRSKKMLARLPSDTQRFLESKFHITAVLEEESRLAYAHFGTTLVNDESGTPKERIVRIYHALYIMGRVDWSLSRNVADGTYIKLIELHKERKRYVHDKALLAVLEKLQSAHVLEFTFALGRALPSAEMRSQWPEYIAHALMPLSCGKLNHSAIADEICRLYGTT
jgi:hypothetical protein